MIPIVKLFRRGFGPLSARVQNVNSLNQAEIDQMFRLMQGYYAEVKHDEFLHDLNKKNDVIVLRERSTGRIMGFSTLKYFDLEITGRSALGVFSGDTIVHEKYWGCSALQRAFLIHLCRLKIRYRQHQLFWFLISKGYKTYLLMANNFPVHFPRFESETPIEYRKMIDEVYGGLYPKTYDSQSGTIQNRFLSYRLKEGIAAPDGKLIVQNDRVRYFVQKNPEWHHGDELACVALMEYRVLVRYMGKVVRKITKRVLPVRAKNPWSNKPIHVQ